MTGIEAGSTTLLPVLQSRSKGVGRRMVQAAENWLRQRGIVKVQLLVRETNTKVVSFYEHLGFEVAPRVVMSRWLGKTS